MNNHGKYKSDNRRGFGHRKGERDLDKFLPDSMKTSYINTDPSSAWQGNKKFNSIKYDESDENRKNVKSLWTPSGNITNKDQRTQRSSNVPSQKFTVQKPSRRGEKKDAPVKITILKPQRPQNNEEISTSSSKPIVVVSKKYEEISYPVGMGSSVAQMKIAPRPPQQSITASALTAKFVPEKKMKRPFRLFDDDFNLCEGHSTLNAYLLDQTKFTVVGVVGLQSSGKSTVASMLADSSNIVMSMSNAVFPVSNSPKCTHSTTGLDIYITSDRLIIMDFPPSLSPGVMDDSSTRDASQNSLNLGQLLNMKSLDFISLALRTCHIVVAVQDNLTSSDELLKLFQLAGATKLKGKSSIQNDSTGVPPSLIVVQNKTKLNLTANEKNTIKNLVSNNLPLCNLKLDQDSNFVFLPFKKYVDDKLDSSDLKKSVLRAPRKVFSHIPYTEKIWFDNVIKEWQKIRKSCLYFDFSKHFP